VLELTAEEKRKYVYARTCKVCRGEPDKMPCGNCANTGRELTKEGRKVLVNGREAT
jgi:hypothetical protein